jgi:signal transduction histidine kinase
VRFSKNPKAAVLFTSGSAWVLYGLAYATAVGLSYRFGYVEALLAGLVNVAPEALAAPIVLRTAAASRGRFGWRLAVLAPAWAAWSILVSSLSLAAMRAWEVGKWEYSLDIRPVVWKALISLLAFFVIAGIGLARFHSREAREASARALRSETLRAEARLAILRAQLNPHFILNVLHSLVGLAEREPRATSGALERLGTTLRYALRVQSRASDRVALRDELAFTRDYLDLERLRLGDRLRTRISADESALDRIVPPFVLQPLVENAVIHAIAPRAKGGLVSISISLALDDAPGGALSIRVEDDGPGTDGEERAADAVAHPGNGLGLALLRDRLAALYGRNGSAAGTLSIDRSPLGGTRASLRLVGEPSTAEEREEGV